MFKSYIVFPSGMQPTIAQAKAWNARMHLLRGVHWGTEIDRPDVLAVEVDTESLHACLQQDTAFEELLSVWSQQGAEVRGRLDFVANRNALQPVKQSKPEKSVAARLLPDVSVRFWQPKESAKSPSSNTSATAAASHRLDHLPRLRSAAQRASRVGPWIFAGAFSIGTLVVGAYMGHELRRSKMERRHDTIERIDESIRRDPGNAAVFDQHE